MIKVLIKQEIKYQETVELEFSNYQDAAAFAEMAFSHFPKLGKSQVIIESEVREGEA